MPEEIVINNGDTVKNDVFEGVASLTSSYTAEDLKEHWILGGGASQADSVGFDDLVIQTQLRPNVNIYIEGQREDRNQIPHANDVARHEIGGNTKLAELVALVSDKIQFA